MNPSCQLHLPFTGVDPVPSTLHPCRALCSSGVIRSSKKLLSRANALLHFISGTLKVLHVSAHTECVEQDFFRGTSLNDHWLCRNLLDKGRYVNHLTVCCVDIGYVYTEQVSHFRKQTEDLLIRECDIDINWVCVVGLLD